MTRITVRKWFDKYGPFMNDEDHRAWSALAEIATDEVAYEAFKTIETYEEACRMAKVFAKNMGLEDVD